jgi:1,2-diacylglycerol 3-alpha-glucosyltransferase
MKVGVIFHRLGPYHVARLSAAAEVCEITAIELAADTGEYAWNKVGETSQFQRVTVFPEGDSRKAGAANLVQRLEGILQNDRPEIVAVPGWSDRAVFAAMRWCLKNEVPLILMSESTAWDERRVWWKEWIKRRVVGLCSAALVGGNPQADYMTQLAMPAERVFLGYDVVDNRYFEDKVAEVRSQKSEVRKKHGLPENYFLASARFIEKKNLFTLLRAYAVYRERLSLVTRSQRRSAAAAGHSSLWSLVLLGDGPLKSDLCRLISDLSLQHSVLLPGFKQYHELPVYYGLASAFVHASTTEQWGLVVNEAMASGLPVLVSDRCGCAADLVQQGCNGFTFDPCNVEQLAQLMCKISAFQPFKLSTFGDASRQIISGFGVDAFARGLLQAVDVCLKRPVVRLGLVDRLLLQVLLLK